MLIYEISVGPINDRIEFERLPSRIVLIHVLDLVWVGTPKHFHDFYELVDACLAWEERLSDEHLGNDAPSRPYVYLLLVIRAAEDKLGRSIVPRANVR